MNRDSEILIDEDEVRDVPQFRGARFETARLTEAGNSRQEKASKPRFRVDSIETTVKRKPQKTLMRVLLRNGRTMKFIRSGDTWTKDSRRARDFHNGWWAAVHAFTMNPRHLMILYQFEDERYNICVPVLGG
jgi:hypothetical protein